MSAAERDGRTRVRLTHTAASHGIVYEREPPFVVVVLADLGSSSYGATTAYAERRLRDVTLEQFDDLVESRRPRLSLQVTNVLDPDATPLGVELAFYDLDDFEPLGVARQISPLRARLEEQTRFTDILRLMGDRMEDGLQELLHSRTMLDRLEGHAAEEMSPLEPDSMLADAVARARIPTSSPWAVANAGESLRILAGLVRAGQLPHLRDVDAMLRSYAARLNEDVSGQLREIMHHPEFQRLEATWRGLRHLVHAAPVDGSVRVRVLDASKDELARDLVGRHVAESTLFRRLHDDVEAWSVDPLRPAMLVGAYEFGPSAGDVELLDRLGQMGHALHAPFIAGADAAAFGWGDPPGALPPRLEHHFRAPEFTRWEALRSQPHADHLVLALPRIRLRRPHRRDPYAVSDFVWEERADEHGARLWGNAALALAACAARTFAREGWCATLPGIDRGGIVDGLPEDADGRTPHDEPVDATEWDISDRRAEELAEFGLTPLEHWRDAGRAVFRRIATLERRPSAWDGAAGLTVPGGLSLVLVIDQIARLLDAIVRERRRVAVHPYREDRADDDRRACEEALRTWLARWVAAADAPSAARPLAQADVHLELLPDAPQTYRLTASVWPRHQCARVAQPVTFTMLVGASLDPSGAPYRA